MRLLRNLLLGLLLLLVLAAGALALWREAALQAAAEFMLQTYGFDQASLTVTRVGTSRIVAETISLGPGAPTLRRAEVLFDPLRLLRGEVQQVTLSGLRLTVEEKGEKLLKQFRFLEEQAGQPGDGGTGAGGGEPAKLPRVTLDDAEIVLKSTPAGDGLLQFSGALQPGPAGLSAQADATLNIGHTTAALTARTEFRDGRNVIVLEGTGNTDAEALTAAGPFAAEAAGLVRRGSASYSLTGEITAPETAPGDWRAWLRLPFSLSGHVNLAGVQAASAPESVSGDLAWSIAGDGESITAALLPQSSALTISGMPPERLSAAGLDLPYDQPLHLRIEPSRAVLHLEDGALGSRWTAEGAVQARTAGAGARLAVNASADGVSGRISIDHATMTADAVPFNKDGNTGMIERADIEFSGSISDDNIIDITGKMAIAVTGVAGTAAILERLQAGTPFRLSGSLSEPNFNADGLSATALNLQVTDKAAFAGPMNLTATELRLDRNRLTASLTLDEGAGEILAGGDQPIAAAWGKVLTDLTASFPPDRPPIFDGTVALVDGSAAIPSAGVKIDRAAVTFPLAEGAVSIAGRIADLQGPAKFTPVSLSLAGDRDADAVTLSGAATTAGNQARVPLQVEAALGSQKVRASVGPAALTFAAGKLQPKNLSPLLNTIRQAIGIVTISGLAEIDPDSAPRLSATVKLDSLSADTGSVQAEGINGSLKFSSLQPLATAGEQTLTVERVVAGVPLSNAFAHFTIPPRNRGLTVNLREAGAALAGGTIRVGDVVYQDGSADLLVRVASLPLDRLLREWKVEGVDGTGVIAGTIPVSIRPSGVGIGDGKLDGQEPGVIQVDFGSARDTLTGAGEQVDLAVRALEEFHYQQLSLGISKPLDGVLTLAIGLDGHNPAVLDGHPFRFNINLSGRLEPILEAIQAGNRISTDLLRGALGQ